MGVGGPWGEGPQPAPVCLGALTGLWGTQQGSAPFPASVASHYKGSDLHLAGLSVTYFPLDLIPHYSHRRRQMRLIRWAGRLLTNTLALVSTQTFINTTGTTAREIVLFFSYQRSLPTASPRSLVDIDQLASFEVILIIAYCLL